MGSVNQSINTIKGFESSYRPTYFYAVTLKNGIVLRFTKASNGQQGLVSWNSNSYLTSVQDENLQGIGAQSSIGLDIFGSITITLGDADSQWWSIEQSYGFQGATVTTDFVYYDSINNQFSTDSKRVFFGTCDSATRNGQTNTVIKANAKNTLTNVSLPTVPIQRTCPHAFPSTPAQRAQANDPLSIFYKCGYSPGISAGNTISPGVYYTDCSREPAACMQRGMFTFDSEGHDTHRYGGVQWSPPATFIGKSYTSGKQVQGVNNANPNKYKQVAPIVWGTAWVTAVQANGVGDPNSTRGEFIIGSQRYLTPGGNDYNSIVDSVVVNGLLIPRNDQTGDLLFRWYKITTGERQGAPNQTAIYNGSGDPYGSLPVIMPIVYAQVASSNSNYSVNVLIKNPPIPVYTAPGVYTFQRTDLLAWVLFEAYRVSKPDIYAQIDVNSVIDYAAYCAGSVSYTNLYGQTASHRRWGVSLDLTNKTPSQNVIEALKMAGGVVVVPNQAGTKLRFVAKKTLCNQQPSVVSGSNYNNPVPSFQYYDDPTGSPTGVGYVAYYFNETNCIKGSINISQDAIANTPVVVQCEINDEDNDWVQGTVSVADATAYDRVGANIQATLPGIGFPNYDQAYRAAQKFQAERYRGNMRADSGGTYVISLQTTSQAAHLNQADIVAFSSVQLNIPFTLFRVEGINDTGEGMRKQLILRWHEDAWYTDLYGQRSSPYTANYLGNFLSNKVPYPWSPGYVGNYANDWLYGKGRGAGAYKTFYLNAVAERLSDNSIVPHVTIQGYLPINKPVNALSPRISRQGSVTSTSGSVPDNVTVYAWLSAIDSSGIEGPINVLPCVTQIGANTGTNSITFNVLAYPPGTSGYKCYVGTNPVSCSLAQVGSGTVSSITITALTVGNTQPIDAAFDHLIIKAKKILRTGYLLLGPGYSPTINTDNFVTASNITFNYGTNLRTGQVYQPQDNELAGRIISAVYQTSGGEVKFLNFRVTANTGFDCTIDQSAGSTDLTTLSLQQTWFIVCHTLQNIDVGGPGYIEGTNLSFGQDTAALIGSMVRVLAGPGADQELRTIISANTSGGILVDKQFSPALTTDSIVIIEEPSWSIISPQNSVSNSAASSLTSITADFSNTLSQGWLIEVAAGDKNQRTAPDQFEPRRIYYWPGAASQQTVYQGQNLLPNADLAESGNVGEIAAGYTLFSNDRNACNVTLERNVVYAGKNSLKFNFAGTGSGYVLQTSGHDAGVSASATTTTPLALAERGAEFFIQASGLISSTYDGSNTPPHVRFVYELRVVAIYDDGTFDDTGVSGSALNEDITPQSTWITSNARLSISDTKRLTNFYATISAYISQGVDPTDPPTATATVLPSGTFVSIYISNLLLARVIDLDTLGSASTMRAFVRQGSMIPTRTVPISVDENSNVEGNCTIALSWPETEMPRDDGSSFTVPSGSMRWENLAIGEYFLYWRISTEDYVMHLASGDAPTVPPMSPSEELSHATEMSGWHPQPMMSIATPITDGESAGYDGGSGTCPEGGEWIYERDKGIIRIRDVQVGDWIKGRFWETGEVIYRKVKAKKIENSSTWRMVGSKRVSPNHQVSFPQQKKWEYPYRIGTLDIYNGQRVSLKLDVAGHAHDDANYALVNEETGEDELIMHNGYVQAC